MKIKTRKEMKEWGCEDILHNGIPSSFFKRVFSFNLDKNHHFIFLQSLCFGFLNHFYIIKRQITIPLKVTGNGTNAMVIGIGTVAAKSIINNFVCACASDRMIKTIKASGEKRDD